ncbi:MAG: TIGR00730 family Rossman fold protein [Acidimicrobiales bacterium]
MSSPARAGRGRHGHRRDPGVHGRPRGRAPRHPRLEVVDSMHARKARMSELADGFVALPGGWGTLEELFEAVTWAQLGLHDKPIGLLNVGGFFDDLLAFVDHATGEGFVKGATEPLPARRRRSRTSARPHGGPRPGGRDLMDR